MIENVVELLPYIGYDISVTGTICAKSEEKTYIVYREIHEEVFEKVGGDIE